jgi:hypothetical protein
MAHVLANSASFSGLQIAGIIVIPLIIALCTGGTFLIRAIINFTKDNTKSQSSLESIDESNKGIREDLRAYIQRNDQDITGLKNDMNTAKSDIKVIDSRVTHLEWQTGAAGRREGRRLDDGGARSEPFRPDNDEHS